MDWGFLPVAPGTWGSLAGIPLGLWMLQLPIYVSVFACLAAAFALSPIARKAASELQDEDAPQIVLDEVIGQALTLQILKKYALHGAQFLPISYIVYGFILFRIFDIFKPFPANLLDRQKSMFGLFGDDIVAGLYAALALRGILKILPAL